MPDGETVHKIHKWALRFWLGPGLAISILLALFTGMLAILIWNLALSVYTIAMEHFLGARQEKKNAAGC